jgi:tetratricopeptide (TPR) repeat protein
MSDTTPAATTAPGPKVARRRVILLAVLAIASAVAVFAAWRHWRSPALPELDLASVDPAIVEKIDAARAELRAAPRSATAWGRLGMVLRAHGFGGEANDCFAQAERLDPSDPRWPYLHGLTVALTDRDAAIPLLQRAADRSRNNSAPRLRLAEVLMLQGKVEDAERHFRSVANIDSGNVRAELGLARIARQQEDFDAALGHLNQALASPLARKAVLTMRAEVHAQRGSTAAARADLAQAAALPDDPPWPDPMVEDVERLTVGVEARLVLAEHLFRQGRAGEAIALLEDTARSTPTSDAVFLALGYTLLRMNQPAQAESSLRRAVELAPAAAEAHFQLGNALFLQQQTASAAASFRAAIHCNPGHALAHYNLGHCLMRQGDRSGAIGEFRAAMRYRPNYADAHTNLGDLLAQDGRRDEALEHLEHAVRLAPGDERARRLLAELRKK